MVFQQSSDGRTTTARATIEPLVVVDILSEYPLVKAEDSNDSRHEMVKAYLEI
jgi:hypothetical protein